MSSSKVQRIYDSATAFETLSTQSPLRHLFDRSNDLKQNVIDVINGDTELCEAASNPRVSTILDRLTLDDCPRISRVAFLLFALFVRGEGDATVDLHCKKMLLGHYLSVGDMCNRLLLDHLT